MTREEITALAREAGFIEMGGQHGALRRFAALVQAREGEACLRIVESVGPDNPMTAGDCADEIRARGTK